MRQREAERHRRTHRDTAHDSARNMQVIHERQQVIREGAKTDLVRVTQRMRVAVSATIKSQQSHPIGRVEQTKRLFYITAQTVLKDEGHAQRLTRLAIVKVDAVVMKDHPFMSVRGDS
jgi:hypothetical protein